MPGPCRVFWQVLQVLVTQRTMRYTRRVLRSLFVRRSGPTRSTSHTTHCTQNLQVRLFFLAHDNATTVFLFCFVITVQRKSSLVFVGRKPAPIRIHSFQEKGISKDASRSLKTAGTAVASVLSQAASNERPAGKPSPIGRLDLDVLSSKRKGMINRRMHMCIIQRLCFLPKQVYGFLLP